MPRNEPHRREFLATGLGAALWVGCREAPKPSAPAPGEHPLAARLSLPKGKVRVILDSDTYNEIDDQFALVYAARSTDKIALEAVYAAPFVNRRAPTPAEGMEKSYEEIHRVLDRLDQPGAREGFVFRGSEKYMPGPGVPVESEAVEDLISRGMEASNEPLYVVALGAPTNVASALVREPKIKEQIVVLWLGAQPYGGPSAADFNSKQDVPASQTLYDCGVPLINIPAFNVSEHLRTTAPEMKRYLSGKSKIADYLLGIFLEYVRERSPEPDFPYSKVIWDIATIALLNNSDWVSTELTSSPIFQDDLTWARDNSRHPVRVALDVDRDSIFDDLFSKLAR